MIERHYPHLLGAADQYLQLLSAVTEKQAALIAQWMLVGFIHGVMNTDNMAISGETIDYGPCAFMESYSPSTVFSSIDTAGRYALWKPADDCRLEPGSFRRDVATVNRQRFTRSRGRESNGSGPWIHAQL